MKKSVQDALHKVVADTANAYSEAFHAVEVARKALQVAEERLVKARQADENIAALYREIIDMGVAFEK